MPTPSPTITACVLARNEEARIGDALKSLQGWTDEIIVLDNKSVDATAEVARRFGALVVDVPERVQFDALRNTAVDYAAGEWIFFLDADERVPERLGPMLRDLVRDRGHEFAGCCVPFKNFFCGKWIEHSGWWPGYSRPQLLKNGAFEYGARLHSGVKVQGRTICLPPNPDRAIVHYSYDDLRHYLTKLNRYTDGEAEALDAEAGACTWQAMVAHFAGDWAAYYDGGRGSLDGMHGFVLAFLSGFYRFASRAKLWDRRGRDGDPRAADDEVPGSVGEALDLMARVVPSGPGPWLMASSDFPEGLGGRLVGAGDRGEDEGGARRAVVAELDTEAEARAGALDSVRLLIERMNDATDAEAAGLLVGGAAHDWKTMLSLFVDEWRLRYDGLKGGERDMKVFVRAFSGGVERFVERAKLWELRRMSGELTEDEAVPRDLGEALDLMLHVYDPDRARGVGGAERGVGRGEPGEGAVASAAPVVEDGRIVSGQEGRIPVIWRSPLFDVSGFADEARHLVLGLIEAGEPVGVAPERWPNPVEMPAETLAALNDRVVDPAAPAEVVVWHTPTELIKPSPNALVTVARSMFETDGVPSGLTERLAYIDRLWVPSEFHRRSYARAGVPSDKITVIPESIDAAPFAAEVEPWPLAGAEAFKFLSVFDWSLHKGWDVLLEAFAREFGSDARTGLYVKVSTSMCPPEEVVRQADALLQARTGRGLGAYSNIHIWSEMLATAEMPRLYRAVDAYVTPTRGEGWCRPLMEAMAAGLPAIATGWSGLTEFFDDEVGFPVSFRVEPVSDKGARELPIYAGHRWAEPNLDNLRRRMREVIARPKAARRKGRAAQRRIAASFSHRAVTAILRPEIAACRALAIAKAGATGPTVQAPERPLLPASRPNAHPVHLDAPRAVSLFEPFGRPLRVRWEGDQRVLSSLALVNREICRGLALSGDVELSVTLDGAGDRSFPDRDDPRLRPLVERAGAALSGPPDITVRHHFPPNWRRPTQGKLVVMQPWEWSHLPSMEWVEGASVHADEVWVPSRFVRDAYARSGVPAERVRVVPNGVRPDVFRPDGPVYPLPTQKRTRFLFVGGTIDRKGADLLLDAYLRAFSGRDDVCLIVKDMGTRTFYRGGTIGSAFLQASRIPNGPEIIYLDDEMSDATLASLFRACTCVVLPYRGEGFALPPLEGMACGLPAIVTAGGATDDYLDDTMALRVPSRRRILPRRNDDRGALPVESWELEPDRDALADALRWVRDKPEKTRERGANALAHVREGWDWERAVGLARERLHAVALRDGRSAAREPARVLGGGAADSAEAEAQAPSAVAAVGDSGHISLSLCMIARDEAPRIESALRSIAPYVDEMVVVDTGSTDRTREIALECGARVFDFPWTDSFAEARNVSIENARGDWIFWMDADDVIPPESGEALRELTRRTPERDAAYQVQVRIPPGPGEFSTSVVDHVKLFPNRPDLRFAHRIHEQILPALRKAGLDVRFSDVFVVHEHYDRSDEGQAKKRARDFRLLELDLADHPEHPFVLFNLGMTCLYATHEYEVAAQYLQRSLNYSHPRDSIVRKAYAMLTAARVGQEAWQAAIAANEAGRSHYPDDAELLFQAAQIYQHVGRFDEARAAIDRLRNGRDDPHYRSVDVGLRTYRALHEMALLSHRTGDVAECERRLREAVASKPDYGPAWMDLVQCLDEQGRHAEAENLIPGPFSGRSYSSLGDLTPR